MCGSGPQRLLGAEGLPRMHLYILYVLCTFLCSLHVLWVLHMFSGFSACFLHVLWILYMFSALFMGSLHVLWVFCMFSGFFACSLHVLWVLCMFSAHSLHIQCVLYVLWALCSLLSCHVCSSFSRMYPSSSLKNVVCHVHLVPLLLLFFFFQTIPGFSFLFLCFSVSLISDSPRFPWPWQTMRRLS